MSTDPVTGFKNTPIVPMCVWTPSHELRNIVSNTECRLLNDSDLQNITIFTDIYTLNNIFNICGGVLCPATHSVCSNRQTFPSFFNWFMLDPC